MTDRLVVLTVIVFAGVIAVGGLAGLIWLVAVDKDQATLNVVASPVTAALGFLGGVLASTKTAADPTVQQVAQQARAAGAAETEVAVRKLTDRPGK